MKKKKYAREDSNALPIANRHLIRFLCARYWKKLCVFGTHERLDERIGYYLVRIRQLYAVERRAKELTSEERQQLRQTESLPLLESFVRMSGFPIIRKRNARKPLDWAQWKDYSGILQISAVFGRLPHSENFL